jgi:uncharacterized membrane protein
MSAVIYAAIVVMWAVVLVPMWLRRHDAATESRSVDRFSTAMRTLSRRTTSGPGRRYVVMPRRSEGGVSVHVSGAAAPPAPAAKPARPTQQARRARPARATATVTSARTRTSLVARRRRLMLGLLGLTFFTMLLATVGVISWPLQIVFDVILVAFCMHLRAQVKRAAAIARQRRAPRAPATAPTPRRPASRPSSAPAAPPRPATSTGMVEEQLEATGTDDETWEPVPVPRPTYTLKPPAPVEIPSDIVDPLRDTDPYNSMAAASYDEPLAPGAEIIAAEPAVIDSDLEDILDRRWAVND